MDSSMMLMTFCESSLPQSMIPNFHRGSLLVGRAWAALTGITPFFKPLDLAARTELGLGLAFPYASVGLLVAVLPDIGNGRGRGWFQGGRRRVALQRAECGVHHRALFSA